MKGADVEAAVVAEPVNPGPRKAARVAGEWVWSIPGEAGAREVAFELPSPGNSMEHIDEEVERLLDSGGAEAAAQPAAPVVPGRDGGAADLVAGGGEGTAASVPPLTDAADLVQCAGADSDGGKIVEQVHDDGSDRDVGADVPLLDVLPQEKGGDSDKDLVDAEGGQAGGVAPVTLAHPADGSPAPSFHKWHVPEGEAPSGVPDTGGRGPEGEGDGCGSMDESAPGDCGTHVDDGRARVDASDTGDGGGDAAVACSGLDVHAATAVMDVRICC